ncbi:MAG: Hpt domain-containing protein [Clostridiales bacterium]|nr:Hpt domain-containing protein [Clostridiales bacterium]
MTVQECYEKMGGDYADVTNRLRTDERIKKFLLKVADDLSFANLCENIAARNIPEAFRAAHTLKGVCSNLSLTTLFKSASAITEALRGKEEYSAELEPLLDKVKVDYAITIECIKNID